MYPEFLGMDFGFWIALGLSVGPLVLIALIGAAKKLLFAGDSDG